MTPPPDKYSNSHQSKSKTRKHGILQLCGWLSVVKRQVSIMSIILEVKFQWNDDEDVNYIIS
jgi:hypothetical protein